MFWFVVVFMFLVVSAPSFSMGEPMDNAPRRDTFELAPAPPNIQGKVVGSIYISKDARFSIDVPFLTSSYKNFGGPGEGRDEWVYAQVKEIYSTPGTGRIMWGPAARDRNLYTVEYFSSDYLKRQSKAYNFNFFNGLMTDRYKKMITEKLTLISTANIQLNQNRAMVSVWRNDPRKNKAAVYFMLGVNEKDLSGDPQFVFFVIREENHLLPANDSNAMGFDQYREYLSSYRFLEK